MTVLSRLVPKLAHIGAFVAALSFGGVAVSQQAFAQFNKGGGGGGGGSPEVAALAAAAAVSVAAVAVFAVASAAADSAAAAIAAAALAAVVVSPRGPLLRGRALAAVVNTARARSMAPGLFNRPRPFYGYGYRPFPAYYGFAMRDPSALGADAIRPATGSSSRLLLSDQSGQAIAASPRWTASACCVKRPSSPCRTKAGAIARGARLPLIARTRMRMAACSARA